jgi:hypothetical protein
MESKGGPKPADEVSSTPDAGDEGVTLESIEFVTEGGPRADGGRGNGHRRGQAEMPD